MAFRGFRAFWERFVVGGSGRGAARAAAMRVSSR
jgi:hypothetical protein